MLDTLLMGALLLAIMLVLLAGGVWIAMTLAIVGWVGQAFFTNTLPGKNLFSAFWESNASWELAALPLFIWMGEILFRTKLSEEMFEGLRALAQPRAGPADAHHHPGLRRVRLGLGLVGRDLRHHRQGGAARAQAPRLQREARHRLARHRRHAGHPDPALDHDGGVRGGGRRVDHPHLPGRASCRACC